MDNTGNRIACAENNGRSLTWTYDKLYRLKMERVTTNSILTYETNYTYDEVGNRQTRTTTPTNIFPQLPDQNFSTQYDQNDRLTAPNYTYNENGSTKTAPEGWTYTYDAENHLLTATKPGTTIVYTYDGDGNRVTKSVNGAVTRYLTDNQNPTGYVQVLEEQDGSGAVQKRYTYGLDLLLQTDLSILPSTNKYYGYDGNGSTRQLYNSVSAVSDTYDYDAFGTLVGQTGTSSNKYLFHGEQYDADLSQYYLRARYLSPITGRFWTMDGYEGAAYEPNSLHKYIFVNNNSINLKDYSGKYANISIDPGAITNMSNLSGERLEDLLNGISKSSFELENESTDLGLLQRMFIAESINPFGTIITVNGADETILYNYNVTKKGLILLGALINNRMKDTKQRWPNTIWGVVTDDLHGEQFKHFANYPTLPKGLIKNINAVVEYAKTKSKYRTNMRKYFDLVLDTAIKTSMDAIIDPYGGTTLFVRTKGSAKPTDTAVKLETVGGQDFYKE